MNIQKYIKDCYEIAQSKGFYPDDSKIEDHLMGIVSEIGEAYEAHRQGKFATAINLIDKYDSKSLRWMELYAMNIKSSFEDELADIFIRLFNLCGHYNIEPWSCSVVKMGECFDTVSSSFIYFTEHLLKIDYDNKTDIQVNICVLFIDLQDFCQIYNIPIEKHIQAKIEYNKTREHLHGKKY